LRVVDATDPDAPPRWGYEPPRGTHDFVGIASIAVGREHMHPILISVPHTALMYITGEGADPASRRVTTPMTQGDARR